MLTSSTVLDAEDTVVNKTTSCPHGYFSAKGKITKQVRARGSSYRLYHTHTYTHTHTHTYTHTSTMHSSMLILRNMVREESKEPGDTRKNMNPEDWAL